MFRIYSSLGQTEMQLFLLTVNFGFKLIPGEPVELQVLSEVAQMALLSKSESASASVSAIT